MLGPAQNAATSGSSPTKPAWRPRWSAPPSRLAGRSGRPCSARSPRRNHELSPCLTQRQPAQNSSRQASVDVELVVLRVPHDDPVVVDAVLADDPDQGGAERFQSLRSPLRVSWPPPAAQPSSASARGEQDPPPNQVQVREVIRGHAAFPPGRRPDRRWSWSSLAWPMGSAMRASRSRTRCATGRTDSAVRFHGVIDGFVALNVISASHAARGARRRRTTNNPVTSPRSGRRPA